ncbi:MAG TPA: threonine/serine dehydratase [Roseiflexaceae bacterium]|nr:threonine/serine dehydratase [Roseiflexaceae bacterium]
MHTMVEEVLRAEARIRPYVRETPLVESMALSELGGRALVKLENLQSTGSFKVRGALNALLVLPEEVRARGVVAASSGNHGTAVAYGARALGVPALVFVPEDASPVKVAAMRRLGAEVRTHGSDTLESELAARTYAAERGLAYLSPYNDPLVVAGQGTVGEEIARQAGRLDALVVAVGGGGLIGGTAAFLRARWPGLRVIGAQPERSAVMAASVRAGAILDLPSEPTLSDGTAGGVEPGAVTFELCRALIDEFVLVSEEEIAAAMRLFIEAEHMLIEGAAGVAVAAYRRLASQLRGQTAGVVICGANVSLTTLKSIL